MRRIYVTKDQYIKVFLSKLPKVCESLDKRINRALEKAQPNTLFIKVNLFFSLFILSQLLFVVSSCIVHCIKMIPVTFYKVLSAALSLSLVFPLLKEEHAKNYC